MIQSFLLLLMSFATCAVYAHDYVPHAERVVANIHAIVGPLGQRSVENAGSNANFGFIITTQGVILIDSGASKIGAEQIAAAIAKVTDQPVRWVINTGSQDHRWLGNAYFARQGATLIALKRTAATQADLAQQHLQTLARFIGEKLQDTHPLPATTLLDGDEATLELAGETLKLRYTDAHFPGDTWVWLPKHQVIFTGDLVYVDRLLAVLPWSSVKKSQQAFRALENMNPIHIVPGHGRVCDLAQAKRESGDYEDFLADTIGKAAQDMEPMSATLDRYADLPQFAHLYNFSDLHRANMNRAFVEFEAQ